MPKRRARLTLRKKSTKGPVPLGHDKDAPTASQWIDMPQYGIFQVSDEDGKAYDFAVGDFARILPSGRQVGDPDIEIHDYWVCKILEVRARNEQDVWILVEWCYSAWDTTRINDDFDASHCGKYERLRSNHTECVSSNCFDGLARVKHYDETNLDQETIGDEEFYYRYTIKMSDKSISPTLSATCVCGCLYNPSDIAYNSVMHLCLQPSCRKYYHRGCVASTKTTTPYERIHFILTDPDTGASLQLPLNESASAEPPKKRRRASDGAAITNFNPAALGTLLAQLPPTLVHAAAQPIVRGGVFGVAGNVAAVVAARRIVRDALQDGTTADGWETRMVEGWENAMPAGWATEEVLLGGVVVNVSDRSVVKAERAVSASAGGNKSKGPKGKGKARVKAHSTVLQCPECGEAI
ncbi:hypothetical protein B0H12DRAFT_1147323 [Mycena haematopus]|nr:hypothetical protein B0H12DRAFT_1147323 [Mycena haematopus]